MISAPKLPVATIAQARREQQTEHQVGTRKAFLKQLPSFSAAGGVFYAAHCHEKSMRAFVEHGGGDWAAFEEAALARASRITGGASEMSALGGN